MIEVQNLSKKFANDWALKDTSWNVADQRAVGLLGPNGAGKSTSMKIMTGLLCPTSGQVLIDGESVTDFPLEVKKKIGYLPETPPLYEDLKVYDFFNFVCGLRSINRMHRARQIDQVIEKLSLQEMVFRPIQTLSKGYKQRVGIAQALLGEPSILIFDEPSVGLDPQQVVELRNIIKSLKQDHIVVLSTHILSEVEEICDDVVILDRGEVKLTATISELKEQGKKLEQVFVEATQ